MRKIATIVGARPQFIKAAPVSRAFSQRRALEEILIHTGQHFDPNMSEIFFEELQIPKPDYNLGIGGGSHGQNTGRMLEKIEEVLLAEKPDLVLVYGDTDSTLAGALAATKLHFPVAHVEAGLRSYNRRMPEEINRILVDQLSTFLFCPTEIAVNNLHGEGFPHVLRAATPIQRQIVCNVGDVMYDAARYYADKAQQKSTVLDQLGLDTGGFILATVHRAENTDDPERLALILEGFNQVAGMMPVIMPIHPRTRKMLKTLGSEIAACCSSHIKFVDPLGYLDMVMLEKHAAVIATDSGGVQKEAYFHGVPCVTLREETEWVELIELGWNRLAPPGKANIAESITAAVGVKGQAGSPYGQGFAAAEIVKMLEFYRGQAC